jgi:hypothetical protein
LALRADFPQRRSAGSPKAPAACAPYARTEQREHIVAYLARLPDDVRFPVTVTLTPSTLFTVGASRAVITRLGWMRSGLEMLFVGALTAAVAYSIGALVSMVTGT